MTPLLFLSRKAGRMCIRLFYLFLRNYEAEANTARKSPQTSKKVSKQALASAIKQQVTMRMRCGLSQTKTCSVVA